MKPKRVINVWRKLTWEREYFAMRLDHPAVRAGINKIAEFLATATGFAVTFVALVAGVAIGALVQFNDAFMFGFNLLLSAAAILISGIILVSGARSEAALQVKLDHLIECSKASNTAIGLEHKDLGEIERERRRVEQEASRLDEAVREEVADELERRGIGP